MMTSYKIYKHNQLIQSKSAFSAMEHKIILLAMVQIQSSDPESRMYRIRIPDVLGKHHTSHYDSVRRALKKLHQSVIEMESPQGWKTYSFITKAQGDYGKNYIEIQFHADIQHFLLDLRSHYTSYTLKNVINFKKNYSLRIYELCKQYQKLGQRMLSLSYLRTLFSLQDKYRSVNLFKKYVLDAALEEINAHSDLLIHYADRKEGRTVTHCIFFIHTRNAGSDPLSLPFLSAHPSSLLSTSFPVPHSDPSTPSQHSS